MKNWYEGKSSVLSYIKNNYQKNMGEPINESLKQYLSNIGLGSMELQIFVSKFGLKDKSFKELMDFVTSKDGNEEIVSYYSKIIYSTISDRRNTANDNYDYGEGKFTKRFK